MAAVAAEGTTVIDNAAREPEVVDLGRFLIAMGARIEGLGTDRLVIDGVARLVPTTRPYAVCADRIETGTWLAAAAATGGDVEVYDTDPTMLGAVMSTLTAIGCDVTTTETTIRVRGPSRPQPFELTTEPFPGFPTDMQAQLMIAACLADGTSRITETIFENRFMHCAELLRMGARISTTRSVATIEGQPLLRGSPVMASDLRASAALVIAGLAAQGMTEILRIYHLDRGYERIVEKLRGLNGRIARVSDAMRDREELRRALDRPPTAP
jgi:UDP-N-acetylglucosamine 1-carboxyvinyltransferase